MKIFNIMLSKDLGGIQQAFLDYNILLKMGGYEPISIVAKDAQVASSLQKDGQTFNTLSNISHFDIFAIWKLRKMILKESPKALILHGNRAINLAYWASFFMKNRPILISVAHNYSYRHLKKCDYIFSITQSMTDHLIKNGVNRGAILNMPNFIDTDAYNFAPKAPFKHISKSDKTKPLRIGTLARFVHKKGVDILIKSISILKKQGYNVTLLIGGEGSEKDALNRLITELDLTAEVKFLGWVRDKESFFEQIDIFCLPSREEPFGIIILEAMLSRTPIIATKTDGPLEVLTHNHDALLVEVGSTEMIADSIAYYSNNPDIAVVFAENAHQRLSEYNFAKGSKILKGHLSNILS